MKEMLALPTSPHWATPPSVSCARHERAPKEHAPQLPKPSPLNEVCHALPISLEVSEGKILVPSAVRLREFPLATANDSMGISVERKPKFRPLACG